MLRFRERQGLSEKARGSGFTERGEARRAGGGGDEQVVSPSERVQSKLAAWAVCSYAAR